VSVSLYFDHHVPKAIAVGVREQGIDVLTADEDGKSDWDDVLLLQRATELGRVIFTQDSDFLVLAAAWQTSRREFSGLVYAHQLRITIGGAIHDFVVIASLMRLEEMRNRVEFLPLGCDRGRSLDQDLGRGGYAAVRHLEAILRLTQYCEQNRPNYRAMTDEELERAIALAVVDKQLSSN